MSCPLPGRRHRTRPSRRLPLIIRLSLPSQTAVHRAYNVQCGGSGCEWCMCCDCAVCYLAKGGPGKPGQVYRLIAMRGLGYETVKLCCACVVVYPPSPIPLCKSLQSQSMPHTTTTSQATPRHQLSNSIYTYPELARATRHKTQQHKHNTTSQSHSPDIAIKLYTCPGLPGPPFAI
jgi:hypothetical protein